MLGGSLFYSRWKRKVSSTNGEQFFTQACSKKMAVQTQICFSTRGKRNVHGDFLLTVCAKFFLYKLRFFPLLTVDTKNFYTNAVQIFTHGVYQKTSIKTEFFSTHSGYTKFSN